MKQIIQYLYEYENGIRIRNIGFIKMEKKENQCLIQIHGKGVDFGPEKKLEVYVFYIENGACVGVLQGTMEETSPVISCILKFDKEDMGGEEQFDGVAGIVIQNSAGQKYAAVWTDTPVDVENMRIGSEEQIPEESDAEEVKTEEADSREERQEEVRQEEPVHETLVEHVERLVEKQEVLTLPEEEVDEYIQPKTRTYEKIQRKDISRLPRKEWKLANNSFLLHGFYNYHHLMFIEEEGNRWIGVPGIYHEKEMAAARAFGFPQFHRITDTDVSLSKEEKNTYDDFGYWCRRVEC